MIRDNFKEDLIAVPYKIHPRNTYLITELIPFPSTLRLPPFRGDVFRFYKNMKNDYFKVPALPLPIAGPPARFNVNTNDLSSSRADLIDRAVRDGLLDGYFCDGQLWVSRGDLQDLLPGGHCTYDPDDHCCYIPDQSNSA